MRKRYVIKWVLIVLVSLFAILISFGVWFISLLPLEEGKESLETSSADNIPYLSENVIAKRGKILAVVTSTASMGSSGKSTGYELTELSRAYYVFKANGFEVDIASPLGGSPPVVIDSDDMRIFDYAFLNDSIAQHKANHTIELASVNPENYQAVFFAGGKGAMFDFPDNKAIQSIVRNHYQSGKAIGAVCHGPAALVNVRLDNGEALLKGKKVSAFTNREELLLIPKAQSIFPFLLQDKIIAQGALFNEGQVYLENISHDQQLITGQNPWSTWKLAETMVKQLGYQPKPRLITAEENTVQVLVVYEKKGPEAARALIDKIQLQKGKVIERELIASHSVLAVLQGDIGRFFGLVALTSYAQSKSKN